MKSVCILFLLFLYECTAENKFNVDGGSIAEPLYDHWYQTVHDYNLLERAFAYSLVGDGVTVNFNAIPQTKPRFDRLLANPPETDLVSTPAPFNVSYYQVEFAF
jgi:hypothetical protein